ncbi:uncharacterized protein LOC113240235 isoform X1 [Hyposmocoma kahamanoa]|uniref:uncharacterized protein LOC113240235 isoform X1 n=1 Tax=Hyposmocoma kahamanoa TaxID=1477025 RepID=UPI000E6D90FF|nr:uncharacterized protein LOC113240235 isoform X1 [Hyposmocoma kahamanoa]
MLPGVRRIEHHEFNLRLLKSLFYAARIVDGVATDMYHSHGTPSYQWQRTILGHTFSVSQAGCYDHGEGAPSLMNSIKAWLTAHEEAQVMLASVLVVVGLWWLVRTILALLINLICPLMVVLLAVYGFHYSTDGISTQPPQSPQLPLPVPNPRTQYYLRTRTMAELS